MQTQNDELINASNQYYKRLNGVNLLLLKEHSLLLQRKQYQQQLTEVNKLIESLQNGSQLQGMHAIQAQFDYLHKLILMNKKQIGHLSFKLQSQDAMFNQLSFQNQTRKKYEKLIDTDYQNGIQQKLSMIRGKVDDLKKKIKEINKDILSNEQEHGELIDEYSFELKTYECYKDNNKKLQRQIEQLRSQRKK